MAKASINFQPVGPASERHNRREKMLDYVNHDRTSLNQSWEAATISEIRKFVTEQYAQEHSGRKLPSNSRPIREAVVNITPDTTMDDLWYMSTKLRDAFGIQVFQIHIHRDEGHFDRYGTWNENCHAHILANFMPGGRSVSLRRNDMRNLQTITAESLNMERGMSSSKKHLGVIQYKVQEQRKELAQLDKELKQADKELHEKNDELYKTDAQIKTKRTAVKSLETMIENLNQQIAEIQDKEAAGSEILKTLEDKLTDKQIKLDKAKEELETLTKWKNDLQQDVNELMLKREKVVKMKPVAQGIAQGVKEGVREWFAEKGINTRVREQNAEIRKENDVLRAQNEELRGMYQRLAAEYGDLSGKNEKLLQQNAELTKDNEVGQFAHEKIHKMMYFAEVNENLMRDKNPELYEIYATMYKNASVQATRELIWRGYSKKINGDIAAKQDNLKPNREAVHQLPQPPQHTSHDNLIDRQSSHRQDYTESYMPEQAPVPTPAPAGESYGSGRCPGCGNPRHPGPCKTKKKGMSR